MRADPIAAILYNRGEAIDDVMATVAARLRADGVRVGGLMQCNYGPDPFAPCSFEFEDVLTSARYRVTRDREPGAPKTCALDLAAFMEASVVLRQAIAHGVELVIANRFGAQEAGGHGMRPELLHIAASGIPLLTAVSPRYLAQWRAFVGEQAVVLPMSVPEVLSWASAAVGRGRPAAADLTLLETPFPPGTAAGARIVAP